MKDETGKILKDMRIEHGYTTLQIAEILGISEAEYIAFENGADAIEDEYYLYSALNYVYGVSIQKLFENAKDEKLISDIIGDFSNVSEYVQKEFLRIAELVDSVTFNEVGLLRQRFSIVKFRYRKENGNLAYAILTRSNLDPGYYFVVLNGDLEIAKLSEAGDENFFEIGGRLYPVKFSDITVLAKIYARLDLGDE